MQTQDIANRLVELCRKGDFEGAQKELFSEEAVSIEPHATPVAEKETKGIGAIKKKGEKWNSMVKEMTGLTVSSPLISNNSFACTMNMKVTMKEGGPMDLSELCVYQVKDGKIISEQFYM
jgi:hypothetical protein